MSAITLLMVAEQLLTQAALVRRLFPNEEAVRSVVLPQLLLTDSVTPAGHQLQTALRCLNEEILTVQAGRAASVEVLDDEIELVRKLVKRSRS